MRVGSIQATVARVDVLAGSLRYQATRTGDPPGIQRADGWNTPSPGNAGRITGAIGAGVAYAGWDEVPGRPEVVGLAEVGRVPVAASPCACWRGRPLDPVAVGVWGRRIIQPEEATPMTTRSKNTIRDLGFFTSRLRARGSRGGRIVERSDALQPADHRSSACACDVPVTRALLVTIHLLSAGEGAGQQIPMHGNRIAV